MKRILFFILAVALICVPVAALEVSDVSGAVQEENASEVPSSASESVESSEPPEPEPLEPVGDDPPEPEPLPPVGEEVEPVTTPEEFPGGEVEGEEELMEDETLGDLGPYPVYLVAPPVVEAEGDAEVLADHGTAYPGTVSTSIYQYFRGLAAGLDFGQHYVFYREDRYNYVLAYSEELELSGDTFSAPSVQYWRFDTDTGYNEFDELTQGTESNFEVSAGTAMVYSDLDPYPPLYEGVKDYEVKALLLLIAGGIIGSFVLRLFSF